MMGKSQRRKGVERERQLVNRHRELGIHAERVPLSGAAHYRGADHDLDVFPGYVEEPVRGSKKMLGFKR